MRYTQREDHAPAPRRSFLDSVWRLIGVLTGLGVLLAMGGMLLTGGACIAMFSHTVDVIEEMDEAEREAQGDVEPAPDVADESGELGDN
tara:strand:- start:130 stop:396 length:267 start_codon:yes stop_codon:yes gene_type:complete